MFAKMMNRLQVICTTDQIKEAKRNVQKYMRRHGSDEDFIENISDEMAWSDYDKPLRR